MMVSSDLIEIQLKKSHIVAGKHRCQVKMNLFGSIDILHVSYCDLIEFLFFFNSFTNLFLENCQFGAEIPTLT